jgi:VanZ family protein
MPGRAIDVVLAWVPVLAWMGLIGWLSSDRFSKEVTASWLTAAPGLAALGLTPSVIEAVNLILRKSAHFVEYAVLSILAYGALGAGTAQPRRRVQLLGTLALALLCAGLDEWHQATTASRSGIVGDVVLDSIGALAGALGGGLYRYHRSRGDGGA